MVVALYLHICVSYEDATFTKCIVAGGQSGVLLL